MIMATMMTMMRKRMMMMKRMMMRRMMMRRRMIIMVTNKVRKRSQSAGPGKFDKKMGKEDSFDQVRRELSFRKNSSKYSTNF